MTRRKKSIPFLKRYRLRFARKRPPAAMWEALLVILFGAVMIYAYSFAKKITYGSEAEVSGPATSIRVQILNGCGLPGAASDASEFLRRNSDHSFYYDVIDQGNFATFDVSETLVLDRGETTDRARSVAAVLGVSNERVLRQPLPDNVLDIDVTIVLGRDFDQLNLERPGRP